MKFDLKYLNMFITAINSIHDGIVLVDKDSKIIYVNDAYSKILHVNKDKVFNKFVSEIEPGALILETLKTKEAKVNTIVTVKSVNKKIALSINPIIYENELLGAVSVFKDITEIAALTKELNNMKELTGYLRSGIVKTKDTLPKSFSKIIGSDSKFVQCLNLAAIVAPTDAVVLVNGESGAGKEVIVDAIFNESKRAKKPFVKINCSAIPENLFESELFGYMEGAFTGAKKGGMRGKFEIADNGTIFLDEIGEMPLLMQAKLLRVLQFGEIQKIGSNNVQHVDVRVIAATNKELRSMVHDGTFREDLYFRLNTFNITIPPLRERRGDIIALSEYFLNLYSRKYKKSLKLSEKVADVLKNYSWPGNVRQLQSCIEFSVVICQGNTIGIEHLPKEIVEYKTNGCNHIKEDSLKNIIVDVEKEKIMDELKKSKGNRTHAMKKLGMSRRTFYRKLKIYDINPDKDI